MTAPLQASTESTRDTRLSPDPEIDPQAVLTAFDDDDCRAILEATADGPLTAPELSEQCDVPLSTVYRKLDLLTDAALLEEGVRLRSGGDHLSEYRQSFENVQVSVAEDGGFEVGIAHEDTGGAGLLAD